MGMIAVAVLGLCLLSAQTRVPAESYRKQALEFSKKKLWTQAIANYRKALALDPADPDTHYNLALALKYSGNPGAAVGEFEAALRLKPDWPAAHFGLGAAEYERHNQAAALREFRAALAGDPNNVGAHYFLAVVLMDRREFVEAIAELKRTLDLRPSHSEACVALGLCYL